MCVHQFRVENRPKGYKPGDSKIFYGVDICTLHFENSSSNNVLWSLTIGISKEYLVLKTCKK